MKKSTILLTVLSIGCASALAQDSSEPVEYYAPEGWSYNIAVSSVSLDSEAALEEGIDDSAISVGLGANYRSGSGWVTSMDLDFIIYDDNEAFSQMVVGSGLFNDGDVSTESSDANAFGVSVASGYEWTFGADNRLSAILQGGGTAILLSERSIANCTDCREEDIDIDSGLFVGGKLSYSFERFSVGLNARQYVTGDGLSNLIGLTFDTKF